MKRTLALLILSASAVQASPGFSERVWTPFDTAAFFAIMIGAAALIPTLAVGGISQFGLWAIVQPLFTISCGVFIGTSSYRAKPGWIRPATFGIGMYALTTLSTNILGQHFLK